MRIIIFCLLFVFIACSPNKKEIVVQGEAQGTTYTVKYISTEDIPGIKERIDSLLAAFDLSLSTYKPNSIISKLNRGEQVKIDHTFKTVWVTSLAIQKRTMGAFDPSIGPIAKAWGFDFENPRFLDSTETSRLMAHCGLNLFRIENNQMIKLDSLAYLNFNAIAQGYAVDLMANILIAEEIHNYYVELGGELVVSGKNKNGDWWRIGIDKPIPENYERELSHIVSLENRAMATSGNYRKFYEYEGKRYPHTINPITGFPVQHQLLSATVFANSCMEADAFATALMVMGTENAKVWLSENPEIDAVLISAKENNSDFETFFTEDIKERLEILEN